MRVGYCFFIQPESGSFIGLNTLHSLWLFRVSSHLSFPWFYILRLEKTAHGSWLISFFFISMRLTKTLFFPNNQEACKKRERKKKNARDHLKNKRISLISCKRTNHYFALQVTLFNQSSFWHCNFQSCRWNTITSIFFNQITPPNSSVNETFNTVPFLNLRADMPRRNTCATVGRTK